LRAEASGCGYLHLAAHGKFRFDVPNSSFIELADGLFHPHDAQTLPLADCCLVALSACETGRGTTAGGDDQVGMVRAFGLAGARAVLATLWRVDDVASMVLMELFYERLAAGATPSYALSTAQRAFIAGAGGGALRSPYYWAGYHLVE
jgi:CHAT domain-containing protein